MIHRLPPIKPFIRPTDRPTNEPPSHPPTHYGSTNTANTYLIITLPHSNPCVHLPALQSSIRQPIHSIILLPTHPPSHKTNQSTIDLPTCPSAQVNTYPPSYPPISLPSIRTSKQNIIPPTLLPTPESTACKIWDTFELVTLRTCVPSE